MLIDFSLCQKIPFEYGGLSCLKQCIIYNDMPYMLKLPYYISEKNQIYNNEIVICEYLGSQIYASLGIPVHTTLLGTLDGFIVVACQHMQRPGEYFVDFSRLKKDYLRTHKTGMQIQKNRDLKDTLEIIRLHPWLIAAGGAVERFWDMFIIDFLIANYDRNNGNWGILTNWNTFRLAPVFDNGSCFRCNFKNISGGKIIQNNQHRHFLYAGHTLTISDFIHEHSTKDCKNALKRIVKKLDLSTIEALIARIKNSGIITQIQADVYSSTLEKNLKALLS
ncbi:hypothetical protein [uncultured Bilophila sp.]|uniref:hypothetical protein n=1 Tax=uncultured Bilophila sp. TaxID=529385 RepID=UPI002601A478|nr:hypothetical protein [uncultured Bilophila sp.]